MNFHINLLNINTKNQPSISDRTDRYFKSEDNQIQNQSDSDKNVQRLKTITEILKTHELYNRISIISDKNKNSKKKNSILILILSKYKKYL